MNQQDLFIHLDGTSQIIQERAKSARATSARMRSLPSAHGYQVDVLIMKKLSIYSFDLFQSRVESVIESHVDMFPEDTHVM